MSKFRISDDVFSDDIQVWGEYAKCKGQPQEWWYVEDLGSREGRMFTRQAKALCDICLVRKNCLDYANTNEESFGVWGGLTPKERGYKRTGRTVRVLNQQAQG